MLHVFACNRPVLKRCIPVKGSRRWSAHAQQSCSAIHLPIYA